MLRQAHGSPKLAHLKQLLRLPRYQVVGLLESLWHFTATQAPRGDVGKWSDGQIAGALEWDGEPAALVAALVEARLVDRCCRHRLLVHDWPQHSDQAVKRSPQVREHGFAQLSTSDPLVIDASVASDSLVKSSTAPSVTTHPDPEPDPDPEPEPEPDKSAPSGALAPARPVAPKPRARRATRTPAPEALSGEQRTRLWDWCKSKHPRLLPRLGSLEDACLGHHRGCGNLKADWCETVMTWIRNEADGRFSGSRVPPEPSRPRPPLVAAADAKSEPELELARRREAERLKRLADANGKLGPLANIMRELVTR